MKQSILSLYDMSGIMVEPWLDAGYRAYIVDWLHTPGVTREGSLVKIGGDMRDIWQRLASIQNVVFVAAFPPCTDLAVSGARWFERKRELNPQFQEDAMELVHISKYLSIALDAPYMIENPVSVISTLWRKPDHIFHPWHYSGHAEEDHYTKKTCLWVGNGFRMPELYSVLGANDIDTMRIWWQSPGEERAKNRSLTPIGFARAVFEANRPKE